MLTCQNVLKCMYKGLETYNIVALVSLTVIVRVSIVNLYMFYHIFNTRTFILPVCYLAVFALIVVRK